MGATKVGIAVTCSIWREAQNSARQEYQSNDGRWFVFDGEENQIGSGKDNLEAVEDAMRKETGK